MNRARLPEVKEDDWNDLSEAARRLTLSNKKIPTHNWMKKEDRKTGGISQ